MTSKRGEAVPNVTLYNLRDKFGQSQDDVAMALTRLAAGKGKSAAVTANQVSRWERGVVHPSPFYRQLLAEHFGVSVSELGLARQRTVSATPHVADMTSGFGVLSIEDDQERQGRPEVVKSQQEWLLTRMQVSTQHSALARLAVQLYPDDLRLSDKGLIAQRGWIFAEPVELARVRVIEDKVTGPPAVDGSEKAGSQVRPLRTTDSRYQRYSHAIRDVAKPKLFENRLSWRLTGVDFHRSGGDLRFGLMNYFEAMDISEALAHEVAATHIVNDVAVARPSWRELKLRKEIGSPFDLQRRAVIMSINTLTIRLDKSGSASVILHNRSAANVATSGGVVGVMPAGVFQPSTVRPGSYDEDFDLWRNIMREYSEEFLGNPEHSGDGPGADYAQAPFSALDEARRDERVRVYCLGLSFGALDLWAGLETVAVFDADTFDEIFADLVEVNDEGTIVRVGSHQPTAHVPFTEEVIRELDASGRLAPETAFSLWAAWRHREQLLETRA